MRPAKRKLMGNCVPLTAATAAADMQSVLIIRANQLGAITLDGQLV